MQGLQQLGLTSNKLGGKAGAALARALEASCKRRAAARGARA
jgi:hypothetical protein